MNALRAAVIGVGYLGRFHAQKFAALEGVSLVGVADTDAEQAAAVGAQLGVTAYPDYRALFGNVDLVSIAAPTEAHYQIARDCLETGIHILVEKPVTRTVEQAEQLIALAEARRLVFQVGHLERFNPALLALNARHCQPLFIESHRIAPFKPRGTDVDVVMDIMIHDIDIILNMVASRVVEVRATGLPVLTDGIDIANARLEFANGCVANITASRVSRYPMRRMRLFEHDEYISVDFLERRLSISRKLPAPGADGMPGIAVEEKEIGQGDALLCEIQAFVEAVRTGSAPPVSGADGKRALEVALEISGKIRNQLQQPRNFAFINDDVATAGAPSPTP